MSEYDDELLENAVKNASPAELTMMLYNGAIRFANNAIDKIEHEAYDEAHEDIVRVGNIIQELQVSLDFQYPISESLYDLYQYMYRCLYTSTPTEADRRPLVIEVRDMMRDFRDTWKEVMETVPA